MRFLAGLAALALMMLAGASQAQPAPKRVALVIANATYANANVLTNPPNDARIVADGLRHAGFQTVTLKANLGVADFQRALRDFQTQADGAQVALVYYAGHGIEGNGKNWLIPTDAVLNSERDLVYEAIDLDLVMSTVTGAQLRVVILDACRNNPLGRSWNRGTRAVSRGLAGVEADDVLVIYAAAPGQTASDGAGGNSPFATALAQRLPQADLPIQLLGGAVRDDVLRATGGEQRPFVSASITGTPFYLVASANSGGAEQALRDRIAQLEKQGAPGATPASAVATGAAIRDCPECPEMVALPAGSFTMGRGADDKPAVNTQGMTAEVAAIVVHNAAAQAAFEAPLHTVRVPAFAAGRYEVTRGEFAAYIEATGRPDPFRAAGCAGRPDAQAAPQDARLPVICVNWLDAQLYTAWLSSKTGKTYRLLTESEFEYAARAGSATPYWWGATASPRNANYFEHVDVAAAPVRVGNFAPNAFGLYDTAGNVNEWVEDCWVNSYGATPADGKAYAKEPCFNHVFRGGSAASGVEDVRSAFRSFEGTDRRAAFLGFRVARDLP